MLGLPSLPVILVTALVSAITVWMCFALYSARVETKQRAGFLPKQAFYVAWVVLFVLMSYEATNNFLGAKLIKYGWIEGGFVLLLAWLVLGLQKNLSSTTRSIAQTGSMVGAGAVFTYYAIKFKRYHMLAVPAWLVTALLHQYTGQKEVGKL